MKFILVCIASYLPSAETGEWLVATILMIISSPAEIEPCVINKVTGTPFNDSDPIYLDELNSTTVSDRPKVCETVL